MGLCRSRWSWLGAQFADYVLAGAMYGEDGAAFKSFGLACRWSFEGFAMRSEVNLDDTIAADALVDSAGNGLDLWQLGHRSIVKRFSNTNTCIDFVECGFYFTPATKTRRDGPIVELL